MFEANISIQYVTADGLYHYKVLLLGMQNCPAIFQFLLNKVLARHEAYIDDFLVFSSFWEEHFANGVGVLHETEEWKAYCESL